MTPAPPVPRDPEGGVTLVEMLVAVALSALIGLAGFAMLDTILRVSARAEASLDRHAALDRAFVVIGRDILLADAGRLRAQGGALDLMLGPGSTPAQYRPEGGRLIRRIGAQGVPQELVDGVIRADWRVLDAAGGWRDVWPPAGAAPPLPPRALDLRLTLDSGGALRRVFRTTAGRAP